MIFFRKAMILLTFIFIIGSFPSITSACSCAELSSVEEEFERSTAVFSGKVIDIKKKKSLKGYSYKSVLFEVTNTWKGVEQTQIFITTGEGDGDCGFNFIEGNEYLVYANESTMYGAKSLVSILCSRTNVLSSSQNDLEVLGEGEIPIEEVNLSGKQTRNQIFIWISLGLAGFIVILTIINRRKRRKN
ncbi:hypothetical protein H9635_16950 [Solibacillus sp. A46]|uniref:Tissue inhibitor of metalloproteinase n=1 Tax=Solibacillus faecavium TaxID=2762221 RepID=A0ABR8Y2L1_9BACL|nr:hypothetical protein [Solibacillus faecavium]MBD8038435.1 hypothetical protein [Solibacillus faecavium]